MATTRRRAKGGVPSPDWRELLRAVGGSEDFANYLLEGRRRFLRGEAATVEDVRRLYERLARQVRQDVERLTPGTLRRSHLEAVASRLETRAAELREELLQATQRGIRIAANAAVDAPRRIGLGSLSGFFRQADVAALFADVAERATLALLARTGPDGLRLSDRVWRIGEETRGAIQRIIEDAIARGEDARATARRLEQYLQPGIARPLKLETRRQLKVPADVSMQALRLAVTEVQHAHHEASIAAWSALPSYQGVYWRLSSNHPVEDICDEYARHGGDGFWPAGDEPPKAHPWCRCYVVPKLEPVEQLADRIRAWIEDPSSQPDIERWYQETARRVMRRPAQQDRPAQDDQKATSWRDIWADAAKRSALMKALAEAIKANNADLIRQYAGQVDEAVVGALESVGLRRGPTNGVVIEPLDDAYGVKMPDCQIKIGRDYITQAVEEGRAERVLRTWVHESIHARQPFAADFWEGEYKDYSGYEEGLVEALAQMVIERMGAPVYGNEAYESYVQTWRGIAQALEMEEEALLREFWRYPTGRVRAALLDYIAEWYQRQTGKALKDSRRKAVQSLLDMLFRSIVPRYMTPRLIKAELRKALGVDKSG